MTLASTNPTLVYPAATANRQHWPWLTTLLILIAFFISIHDVQFSRKWQHTLKGDVTTLVEDESNGRLARQVGFLMLGVVGLGLLARRSTLPLRLHPLVVFPLATLLVWACLSAGWSADVSITLKRLVVLGCMLLAVAGLIRQFDINRLTEMAFVHTLVVVLVGIVAEMIYAAPITDGEEYRFAGTLHPNHAGTNAAMLLLCCLFLAHQRANRRILLIAVGAAAVLLLSKSRTALSSVIAGAAVFILLAWPARKKMAMLIAGTILLAVALVLVSADALPHLQEVILLNRQGSDPTTLTGRTMIWQFAYARIQDDWGRILTGFGYGGFWTRGTTQALSRLAHFKLAEGHNAYLDMTLQLGLVGLGLYLWGIVGGLWISVAAARRSHTAEAGPAALAAALISLALVHHVAESGLTAPTFPTLFLWSIVGSAAIRAPYARPEGALA